MKKTGKNQSQTIQIIKNGGIGALKTDTVWGIVASAIIPEAVEKIYKIKKRDGKKPPVIIIGKMSDLQKLKIKISKTEKELLSFFWPGPTSVILPCPEKKFSYLHRNLHSLAIRLPASAKLRNFLTKTGPLATSSANVSGHPFLKSKKEIEKIFQNKIDFSLSLFSGKTGNPSLLLQPEKNKKLRVLRINSAAKKLKKLKKMGWLVQMPEN